MTNLRNISQICYRIIQFTHFAATKEQASRAVKEKQAYFEQFSAQISTNQISLEQSNDFMVLYSYHLIMLSKIANTALRAAFSKVATTPPATPIVQEIKSGVTGEASIAQTFSSSELQNFKEDKVEKLHFNDYVNEIKTKVFNELSINFEDLTQQEVLLLDSPVGQNNWKLAEIITVAGAYNFVGLLAGFPSYAALLGTLGVTGIGAALAYSNYLRRTSPQITSIKATKDGKLHIFYLKPGFLVRKESEIELEAKNFSFLSFGNRYINYLRKSNETNWVSVEGKHFWYNNSRNSVRINSHLSHKLF